MFRFAILVVSTGDRLASLERFIRSCEEYAPGVPIVLYGQGFSREQRAALRAGYKSLVEPIFEDELIGPSRARMAALRAVRGQYDAYIGYDDDMELIGLTDVWTIVSLAMRRGTGFVSGNWARTMKQALAKPIREDLLKQPIVYTGGGYGFSAEVVDVILAMPDLDYLFDNPQWSLEAYLAGYTNYRWRGSVAVHYVCGAGGRHTWVPRKQRVLPDETFFRLQPGKETSTTGKGNGYRIPSSADLLPVAHALHKQARRERFGV